MGLFTTNSLDRELYVPVPPADVYKAVRDVAASRFKVNSEDDFTLAITFSGMSSGFTWGENMASQVVPAEGGATIKLTITPRVGGQALQGNTNRKIADSFFKDVTDVLRSRRE